MSAESAEPLTPSEAQEFRRLQRKWGKEDNLTTAEFDRWIALDRKQRGVREEDVRFQLLAEAEMRYEGTLEFADEWRQMLFEKLKGQGAAAERARLRERVEAMRRGRQADLDTARSQFIAGGLNELDRVLALLTEPGRESEALHVPLRVWQERLGEVSWSCSCGTLNKHLPFCGGAVDLRCAAEPGEERT